MEGAGTMAGAVIVHGGAYTIPSHRVEPSLRGCEKAALEAHRALQDGKSALDAGGSKTLIQLFMLAFHCVYLFS